jgi:hypothetical protein
MQGNRFQNLKDFEMQLPCGEDYVEFSTTEILDGAQA